MTMTERPRRLRRTTALRRMVAETRLDPADLVLAADVFIYVGELEAVFEALSQRVHPQGWLAFTIEEADPGFQVQLHSTLRYSHALEYIENLARRHGWKLVKLHRAPLRLHKAQSLMGAYVYLQKA